MSRRRTPWFSIVATVVSITVFSFAVHREWSLHEVVFWGVLTLFWQATTHDEERTQ